MNPLSRLSLLEDLFKNSMKGNWKEVIKTYKENQDSHTAKITSSGDTALHIAISNGEESVVESLFSVLCEAGPETTKGALEMQNDHGDTPLHLAAYIGSARMCRCIAGCNSKLMGIRNADNETPFFLTVRYGWKEAFQALHEICEDREGYRYCRGKDGETILHSAIDGEHFELAYDIMNHYDKLTDKVNVHGFSPLHILANKPSAFRSGSQIRGLDKLIYHCIFVDELEHKSMHKHDRDLHQYKEGANYPENHHTCITTFNLLRDVMRALLGYSRRKYDVENTEEKSEDEKHANGNRLVNKLTTIFCGSRMASAERRQFEREELQEHEFVPKNYITFLTFLKFLTNTIMLLIFRLGKSPTLHHN